MQSSDSADIIPYDGADKRMGAMSFTKLYEVVTRRNITDYQVTGDLKYFM